MSTNLHVGNIPAAIETQALRTMFGQFGPVDAVEIAIDSATGRHKGYAIVAMSREEDADAAVRRLNFSQLGGRTIGVSKARNGKIAIVGRA